jgi:hypothetical protein
MMSNFASDDGLRPPVWMVDAVSKNEMEPKVLNVWRYVVTSLGDHFSDAAGLAYWRNKCGSMGLTIPSKYIGIMADASFGSSFEVYSGDEIEAWVRESLKSQGLLVEVGKSRHEWEMELHHIERKLQEAVEKIDTHEQGIKNKNRVQQRVKWLDDARKEFAKYTVLLNQAKQELEKFEQVVEQYEGNQNPTLEFEKEFQFLLKLAEKDFSKREILEAMKRAVTRFERGLDIPGEYPEPSKYEGYKKASLLSDLWGFLRSSFEKFFGWFAGLRQTTAKLDRLLSKP